MQKPSRYERLLVITLATIQFTHILDFVIMMPLGPRLMRIFDIEAQQFALLVSSYTFSSAVCGFLGSGFIDRFERKRALIFVYLGFMVGTFACSISHNYEELLGARILAGAFGGLVNTLVFTILGDSIPESRRGWGTGVVMAAFSVSSVLGVPIGLYLAEEFFWQLPFRALAIFALLLALFIAKTMKPIHGHLEDLPLEEAEKKILKRFQNFAQVFKNVEHLRAFSLTVFLMFAAFSLIPFISPYLVNNVDLAEEKLPLVYLFGGGLTFFTSRWIGRLSDHHGKYQVFRTVALLSIIPILALTHLEPVPLPVIILISMIFMSLVSGRFVPAMALITSTPEPKKRGAFMGMNNAIHHLSAGLASMLGGWIIQTNPDQSLSGYNQVGYLAIVSTLICLYLAKQIKPYVKKT